MTLTKRVLSIALAVVLAVGLVVPAFGEGDEETDPVSYAPVITQQLPEGQIYTRTGFNLRLRVAAQLPEMPEGIEGTLSYAWSYKGERESTWIDLPSATGEKFVQKMTMDMVKARNTKQSFRVVVTNTYIDEEGNAQTDAAASETRIFLTPSMIEFYLQYTDLESINTDYWFLFPMSIIQGTFFCIYNNIRAYGETLIRWIRYH